MLSGNRNFEGRISPDVKMNYLASPPLVIAYALAGTMDFDFETDPLGKDTDGNDVFLKDIWPSSKDISDTIASAINQEMFKKNYADVFKGDERWQNLPTPSGKTFEWDANSTYVRKLRTSTVCPPNHSRSATSPGGPECLPCWAIRSPPTTSAPPPATSRRAPPRRRSTSTATAWTKKDYNSYGSRRGNHEVMIRGTFANIRLRNQLLDDVSGGYTRDFTQPDGPQEFIYDAAQKNYAAQKNIPLVVLGGKEYGSGSSRDWAAKGTSLLGVRAVITESFERIHRSNLIGMGVIPLQFPAGESAASLKLDGTEVFDITGIEELNNGKTPKTVHVTATKSDGSAVEFDAWCASTPPPARPTTTATAASCSTCCATCCGPASRRCPGSARIIWRPAAARSSTRRRCFAEYGYEQATVRRLEQTIGLSRGAIFHHYRDKDTLFFALAREDAARMAEVAAREGLIQVMRDMLAAPDQFDWLATRLEIARKLRNDPVFHQAGWSAQRSWRQRPPSGCVSRSRPAGCATTWRPTCCSATWIWCSTDWSRGWRRARIPPSDFRQCWIWWRIRCGLPTGDVVGATAAAHSGARLAQQRVDRAVRTARRRHQGANARAALVSVSQSVQQLVSSFVGLPHDHPPPRWIRADSHESRSVGRRVGGGMTEMVYGRCQASSMRSRYSSDQKSSVPSGSSTTRCGSSASAAPGSWVTSTTAPW